MPPSGNRPVRRVYKPCMQRRGSDIALFFALACAITWTSAAPAARAWMAHENPSPGAIALAGVSAFGPLLAALLVGWRRKSLREVFGRWKTHPKWLVLAFLAPAAIHLAASLSYTAIGGTPDRWLHLPLTPEAFAAMIVFPLGEEFGWRGFLHARALERWGAVRGPLLVGLMWGVWHLAYAITPTSAGFDWVTFAMNMLFTLAYAPVIALFMERSGRSIAVALAIHAGAHFDHLEAAPLALVGLHGFNIVFAAVASTWALFALRAGDKRRHDQNAPSLR